MVKGSEDEEKEVNIIKGLPGMPMATWAPPALPNPAYLPLTHYYAYPNPTVPLVPPEQFNNYSPSQLQPPAQAPPSLTQQQVKAYVQQGNKVLYSLHLSPAEFARCTCTLLNNLGYQITPRTLEVWTDHLFDFHECYQQGSLPETTQGTLGINANLWNKLHALVKEIHTSTNPCQFENPLDLAHSFHIQKKGPIRVHAEALAPIPCQQKELNAVSDILRSLNPAGGLFDQPAIHTLALSTHPRANSIPSAFCTWDQPTEPEPCTQKVPQPLLAHNNLVSNHTLSYISKPENAR
ncbi:hypothetical protein C0989_007066 [Termitomyces sp. Mn162]|nr:hypothetical protein C0989_007066 [Termitomyces sp. Mn162]